MHRLTSSINIRCSPMVKESGSRHKFVMWSFLIDTAGTQWEIAHPRLKCENSK